MIEDGDEVVREAGRDDAAGILRVEERCFATSGERFNLRQIRALIANPKADTFIAGGKEVAGWGTGLVRRAGRAITGRVYAVAVLPEARGTGLGRRLMVQVLAALRGRGAGRIFLEVRSDNVAAINLYRKLGFCNRRAIRDYYGRGLDALGMVLEESK